MKAVIVMTSKGMSAIGLSCLLVGCDILNPFGTDATAGLQLTIETRGPVTDKAYFVPDGYRITVDGKEVVWQGLSGSGGTTIFAPQGTFLVELTTGSHELELLGVPSICEVDGPNPWTIDVMEGAATLVSGVRLVEGNDFMKAIDCVFVMHDQEIVFSGADRFGDVAIFFMGEDGSDVVGLSLEGRLPPAERASQGPTAPHWSPDGNKILFSHPSTGGGRRTPEAEIYVMDLRAAGTVVRLTQSGGAEPKWSPDGTKVAFSSYRDGDWEVYVMDADGSNPINVTNNPARDVEPTWSPDGTRIAFTSHREGVPEPGLEVTTNSEIYVMNADGSNPVNLTNSPALGADRDDHPSWSPDGGRIAFISGRDVIPPHNWALYLMDPDGSNPVNLGNGHFVTARPAWSPTGRRIVVVSGASTLDIVDADGSNLLRLMTGLHPGTSPGELERVNAPSWRTAN